MSDAIKIALITAIATALPLTVIGIANIVIGLRSSRRLSDIHIQINSRMDQLLKMTAAKSLGDGKAEGIQQERDKSKE